MPQNAKDIKSSNKRILAVGSGGSGKTSAFLTLPGKKLLFIFDPSALESVQGQDVDYEIYLPANLDMTANPLKSALKKSTSNLSREELEPKGYVDFQDDFETMQKDGTFDQYDVIGLDSMTTFQDAAMDRLQWLDNRLGTWPRQDDWTAVMSVMRNAIRTITSIPNKTIYITAHSQFKQDETTSKMMNEINLVGGLKVKLPLLFSDIWQFSAETKGEETQFRIQTKPDRYSPYVRCSTQGLKLYEDVTIPKDGWENPEQHGLGKLLANHKE